MDMVLPIPYPPSACDGAGCDIGFRIANRLGREEDSPLAGIHLDWRFPFGSTRFVRQFQGAGCLFLFRRLL